MNQGLFSVIVHLVIQMLFDLFNDFFAHFLH